MASSQITDLEYQLTNEMGFPSSVSKKAALFCGDIVDPEQRLIAAVNFIETDMEENVASVQTSHNYSPPGNEGLLSKRMKMNVCVRKDIGMTPGKIASQVAHACLQLATNLDSNPGRKSKVKEWQADSNEKIVVLECNSLEDMSLIQAKASELGVPTAIIADAGRTEISPGTVTCIAVGPSNEEIIDKITGQLKLYS
jgi:PTH2 family peptidyl-tRNA hydrolase